MVFSLVSPHFLCPHKAWSKVHPKTQQNERRNKARPKIAYPWVFTWNKSTARLLCLLSLPWSGQWQVSVFRTRQNQSKLLSANFTTFILCCHSFVPEISEDKCTYQHYVFHLFNKTASSFWQISITSCVPVVLLFEESVST